MDWLSPLLAWVAVATPLTVATLAILALLGLIFFMIKLLNLVGNHVMSELKAINLQLATLNYHELKYGNILSDIRDAVVQQRETEHDT